MSQWSLPNLLQSWSDNVEHQLAVSRKTISHSVAKGDASENVWIDLIRTYLPERYRVGRAHIVDSDGNFSDQQDVVIYDRQYSPFMLTNFDQKIIPIESVYAVFEVKQRLARDTVEYAGDKVASVRKLKSTSLPIPHAGGVFEAKVPHRVIGGILTFESSWTPPLGEILESTLQRLSHDAELSLGCVAASGMFEVSSDQVRLDVGSAPATKFIFSLIQKLQLMGTIPMMDLERYARWLE